MGQTYIKTLAIVTDYLLESDRLHCWHAGLPCQTAIVQYQAQVKSCHALLIQLQRQRLNISETDSERKLMFSMHSIQCQALVCLTPS